MPMIVPIGMIVILGGCGSLVLRRWIGNPWRRAVAGAAGATACWVGGCYLLFLFTGPDELGMPLVAPVIQTFLTALIPALAVVWVGDQGWHHNSAAGSK